MDYMGRLDREDSIRSNINTTRVTKTTSSSYTGSTNTYSYSSTANQYQGGSYSSADILGTWKHYNLSGATLNSRTTRAKTPLMDRELIRYYGKKPNYIGDVSSGAACDFRQ